MEKIKIGDTVYLREHAGTYNKGTKFTISKFYCTDIPGYEQIVGNPICSFYIYRFSRIPNGPSLKAEDFAFCEPFVGRVVRD